jgi:acyl carrier protein
VSDRLIETFAAVLGLPEAQLGEDNSPANTPEWDSLATVNLTLGLEYEFGVKLTTQEIMSMTSVALARSVLKHKGVAGL